MTESEVRWVLTKEDIYELQHKMIADQLLWEAADSCTQGMTYYLCGMNDFAQKLLERIEEKTKEVR